MNIGRPGAFALLLNKGLRAGWSWCSRRSFALAMVLFAHSRSIGGQEEKWYLAGGSDGDSVSYSWRSSASRRRSTPR